MFNLGSVFFNVGANTSGLQAAGKNVANFGRAMQVTNNQIVASTKKSSAAIGGVGTAAARSQARTSGFVNLIRDLSSASVLVVGPLSGVGARITALGSIVGRSNLMLAGFLGGLAGTVAGLGKLSTQALKTELDFQRVGKRFEALGTPASGLFLQFEDIRKVADRTGTSFVILAEQFTKLSAAAKGTALEGGGVRQIFEDFALIAGTAKLSNEEIGGVLKAIEQMVSKGTVQLEELKNQLGDRLPGALQIAARAMDVPLEKLLKMIKDGKVLAADFLPKFAAEARRTLAGTAQNVTGLQASYNRLGNSISFFNKAFNDTAGLSSKVENAVLSISRAVDYLTNNMEWFIKVGTAAAGSLIGLAAPSVISGIVLLTGGILRATAAMLGFNAAVVANPIGGVTVLLAKLAIAAGGAAFAVHQTNQAFKTMDDTSAITLKAANDFIEQQNGVQRVIKGTTKVYLDSVGQQISGLKLQQEALAASISELEKWEVSFSGEKSNRELSRVAQQRVDILNDVNDAWRLFGGSGDLISRDIIQGGDPKQLAALRERYSSISDTIDTFNDKLQKLQQIQSGEVDPITQALGGPELSKRATKALSRTNIELDKMRNQIELLQAGPLVFEEMSRAIERQEAIQKFTERLKTAEIAQSSLNKLVAEFTMLYDQQQALILSTAGSYKIFESIRDSVGDAMKDMGKTIADAFTTGKLKASDFVDAVKSMVSKIIQAIIELSIINPILNNLFGAQNATLGFGAGTSGIGSMIGSLLGYAKGGAFKSGVQFMAKGGVLNKATAFSTSQGLAVAGEAGAEAVMPLTRDSKGNLGVTSTGSNSGAPTINIYTPPGTSAKTRNRQEGGRPIIDVFIETVEGAIGGGRMDKAMKARYGMGPKTQAIGG